MSINFINAKDLADGTHALADKILFYLTKGQRVLWLIPGGSNIPIAADAMRIIRSSADSEAVERLSIALTDERYGPVGHPDSNWKQLQDARINLIGIKAYPIIDGSSLADTVARYGQTIQKVLKDIDIIVGQFGMGADGHIAGILPHTPAVTEESAPTAGYESKPFTRVSLTFPILRKINVAYMFVSNATKKDAIESLRKSGIALADQPAQILKEIPEVYVYID